MIAPPGSSRTRHLRISVLTWTTVAVAIIVGLPLSPRSTARAATPKERAGEDLLAAAVLQMEAVTSLSARVRCEGRLFDLDVEAEGDYRQMNHIGRVLVRMDLELQTGTADVAIQQVCDGRFLWESWKSGSTRNVGRVDLRELQRQAGENKLRAIRLGSGGLLALMQSISEAFVFRPAVVKTLDELTVFELTGQLPRTGAPESPPDDSQLPPFQPDNVVVMLGTEDLVPYRIQFRRKQQVLLTCELFEVVIGAELDQSHFQWEGDDRLVKDRTGELVDQVR